jgi:hypothetical protein
VCVCVSVCVCLNVFVCVCVRNECVWSCRLTGQELSDWDLMSGLVLRIQSGSNLRSGNLLNDLKWQHVSSASGKGEFGTVMLMNTKRLRPIVIFWSLMNWPFSC